MTEPPLVSVVMCAWKPRADWLHEAVASELADGVDLELIVVDDGSPEPVKGLLAQFVDPRLRIIRVEHGGLSRARNAGIRAARGAYVRFADADDVVERAGTKALLQLIDEDTIAYGATMVCDESLRPLSVRSSQLEGQIAEECLLYRFDVTHTAMLFPKGVLERVGEFDPTLRQCQDWDYVLRACEVAPVRGSQAVVNRYRRHAGATATNVEGALHFESVVVDRYFERHPDQAGSRLEREARAKLLIVRARACPLLGRGRRDQARLVLRAFRLHPRRTLQELGPSGARALIARALAVPARWQLLAGTAVFFVIRLALTVPRTGPVVVADEVGYLTNARLLAGGVPGQLSTAPFYHGGYSLLLAPVLGLDGNPKTSYHVVLVLNAALAASLAPLLYLLLTRCVAVPPRQAVWPSLAAAAYPSVTIYTQVALSENLLLPLFALWLLCLGCFLQAKTDTHRLAFGAAAAVCAVWLWATHGRMIVVTVLTVVAFLAVAALRRPAIRGALLGLVIVALGLVAVHLLNEHLISQNYGGHTANEVDQRLSTVESVGGIGAFLRNIVGQLWYLMVASLGVLVAAAAPREWLARLRRRQVSSSGLILILALLTGLGLLVESALSFRTADRPDMIIYGRYTDVVVPPLVALALVRLDAGRRYRVAVVVMALAVTTVAVALLRTGIHPTGFANRWNVASLPAPTFHLGPKVLLLAGAVAAAVIVMIAAVQRRSAAAVAPLVLLLFLPTTAVAEHSPVLTAQSAFYPSGWTSPAAAAHGAKTIAFDTDYSGGLWVYQWFVPHAKFVLFSGSSERPPARFVMSSPTWAAAHPRLHPTPLWADRSRDRELFRLDQPR